MAVGVSGDEDTGGVERNDEKATHAEEERNGNGGGGVVEVEADTLRGGGGGYGVVEGGAQAEAREDLANGGH